MTSHPLDGRRILVVEDEYYLAMELEQDLATAGAVVMGPVPSIEEALAVLAAEPVVDLAVVDVNLRGEMAYPVADALVTRGIPFVITTGYGDRDLDDRYRHAARCEKPIDFRKLMTTLASAIEAQ